MKSIYTLRAAVLPPVLFFIACFCIYSFTLSRSHLGYEGETLAQARAVFHPGQPMEGRAGLLDVAFYLPFVALAEFIQARGLFPFYQGFLPNFALPFFMALAALFVFFAAREIFTERAALGVGAVFAFGTMAWPYSKMGMELSLTFSTALALWGFTRALNSALNGSKDKVARIRRQGWLLIAAGLGSMLLTKVQAPLTILLFLAFIARQSFKRELALPSRGDAFRAMGVGVIAMVLFICGNLARYDRPFFSTSYHPGWETAAPTPAGYMLHLMGYVASPGKSLFLLNPPLLLLPFALLPFARKHPWYWELLAIFVIPQILFHAYFRTWADETWGPRRLVNLLPVLVLPIGVLFETDARMKKGVRLAVRAVIAAGVVLQLLAVSMNYASYIFTLKPYGLGTQHNIVWSPRLSQIPFQARILASCVNRWVAGESLTVSARGENASSDPGDFLPWNAPDGPPKWLDSNGPESTPPESIHIDLGSYDQHLDTWWALKASRDPDWRWWRDRSFYFALTLAMTGLLALRFLFSGGPKPWEPAEQSLPRCGNHVE